MADIEVVLSPRPTLSHGTHCAQLCVFIIVLNKIWMEGGGTTEEYINDWRRRRGRTGGRPINEKTSQAVFYFDLELIAPKGNKWRRRLPHYTLWVVRRVQRVDC